MSHKEKPSFLNRWKKLPDSKSHWILTIIVLVLVVFLLVKLAS